MSDLAPLTRSPRAMRLDEGIALLEDAAAPQGFAEQAAPDGTSVHRSTIGCVIPACNEEESIAQVIESLLGQTRVPDVVHVVVNNTSDRTVSIASSYAGPHAIVTELGEQFTEVFVHDIGENPGKKAGALNYGYTLVEGCDYLLGVDGDTVAAATVVEHLESEATSDTRIGAISSIGDRPVKGAVATILIAGPVSIFSTQALRDVMTQSRRATPWATDSHAEDPLLSLPLESVGYLTKVRPFARADISGTPLAARDARRPQWPYGATALAALTALVAFVGASLSLGAFVVVVKLIRRPHGCKV